MDRLEWSDGSLMSGESHIDQQRGVGIYDGHDKTSFDFGMLSVTSHRLIWRDHRNRNSVIALPLSLVVYLEEQASGFAKSAKIIVHLKPAPTNKAAGPSTYSAHSYIRLSFRESGEREILRSLNEALQVRKWEQNIPVSQPSSQLSARHRPGIVGIERSIQQKNTNTNKKITVAFEDLSKLIDQAKEMVSLTKTIATKIKEKQGDITENETRKFKSYLLSMGIPNPVTRETHGTGDKYYTELAKQLASVLTQPVEECGGMMTLTDVYCRVNRARGMELLSPEDLLHACELMEMLHLPVRLRTFDSGVLVLQSQSQDEEKVISHTTQYVEEHGFSTAEELAQSIGVSVLLAKERLLLTEKVGGICRDETVEALKFFPNLFLTQPV
ncbi:vacuolar protein-sorting-associated protein 36 [Patella vulgata]|uniref:vacuolar protein-sorting-associated protein 36 n=1 Tax=Patella vulgata TaxID=6465 RepID=UPI00218060AD|nr:vacuolar protein-sorting-associated protein 36 [Patella vulgata]